MSEYDDLLDEVLPDPKPVKKVKTQKKKQATRETEPKTLTPAVPARRGMARQLERSGRCPMYVPRGTVCKSCGKVHPL